MAKKFFDIIPPEMAKEIMPSRKNKAHLKKSFLFVKVLILCFGLLIISIFFFFPKVEIKIWPKTEILNLEEKVKISINQKEGNFEERIIPGEVFSNQKSASQEFSASGKVFKKEKAKGIIKVYNAYSTSPRSLVPSRFVSAGGKLFWSVTKITIPAARYEKGKFIPGEVDIEVAAAEPGESYNIGPTTFALPALAGSSLYTTIYGKSFSPMIGGFISEVAQVTQEDLEEAEKTLTEDLKKESRNLLKTALPQEFVLIEETISQEVINTQSSLEAGAEVGTFDFQAEVKSKGIGFKKSDLEKLTKYSLGLNITEGKKMQEQSLEVNYSIELIDSDVGEVVLNLKIKAKVYSDVNEEELKQALLGKTLREAKIFLENLPQLTKIEIKSWPFFRKKVPEDMQKVEIKMVVD